MSSFFTSKRIPIISLLSNIVLLAVLWIVALYSFPQDTPAAILHYSAGVGIDFIGQGSQIITLPLVATAICVINGLLALSIRRAGDQPALVLWIGTPFVLLVLVGAFIFLRMMNV